MFGLYAAESDRAGMVGFAALWRAYLACRQRKRHTRDAQGFEAQALDRLFDLRDALEARTWRPSPALAFVVDQPKPREIHAAPFADRVVHHVLVPVLEAWFEPVFIHDSFSNRQGKGTHAAVERLQKFILQATLNGQRPAFFLQLDIANFFNSIDRNILFEQVLRRARRVWRAACAEAARGKLPEATQRDLHARINQALWLLKMLLADNAGLTARARGEPGQFVRVPPHKRLINAPEGKGVPIGNLTSQFLANVCLNDLDQFVKHTLGCRHYLRYVDDFVLLHPEPRQLLAWRDAIEHFLAERLQLRLKELPEPRSLAEGVDFLGYVTRRDYRLVRKRVVDNLERKLDRFARIFHPAAGVLRLPAAEREALRATLASYWGHFSHADSFRLVQRIWARHPWLAELFHLAPSRRAPWERACPRRAGQGYGSRRGFAAKAAPTAPGSRLIPRWQPAAGASFAGQWRYFKKNWPGCLVLMQVGNRIEAHGQDAERLLARPSGFQSVKRQGFAVTAWVPLRALGRVRRGLAARQIAHVVVAEEGTLRGGLKRRVLRAAWQGEP